MSWVQNVSKNLLPLSEADTLEQALKEWYATGDCEVRGQADGTCELCEHEDILYEFEINNGVTGNQMTAVGSTCITRFIRLFEGKREVVGAANKDAYLARRRQQTMDALRRERSRGILIAIAQKVPTFPAAQLSESWDKGYTPKQLLWILSSGRRAGVQVDLTLFNAVFTRERYRGQMQDLAPWDYRKIRPALSTAQRAKYDSAFGWKG